MCRTCQQGIFRQVLGEDAVEPHPMICARTQHGDCRGGMHAVSQQRNNMCVPSIMMQMT